MLLNWGPSYLLCIEKLTVISESFELEIYSSFVLDVAHSLQFDVGLSWKYHTFQSIHSHLTIIYLWF